MCGARDCSVTGDLALAHASDELRGNTDVVLEALMLMESGATRSARTRHFAEDARRSSEAYDEQFELCCKPDSTSGGVAYSRGEFARRHSKRACGDYVFAAQTLKV